MFKFLPPAIKPTLTALTLALSAFSLNAQAKLTSYTNASYLTSESADLVYSSVSDVTWTKDANLLGTLIASSTDGDGNGTVDIIDYIVNSYNGLGNGITANDFSSDGKTTIFGALAYVYYLNSINYGGSSQWHLPTVANGTYGTKTTTNGTAEGDELVELFYSELGGTADNNIPDTATFDNEQAYAYWTGTPYKYEPTWVWYFNTMIGEQYTMDIYRQFYLYAWAVTAGDLRASTVSAVPAPAAAWLFATGLPVVGAFVRRRKQQA